jgi:hypothetical protein
VSPGRLAGRTAANTRVQTSVERRRRGIPVAIGQYEQVVQEALRSASNGPWADLYLQAVPTIISDDFCRGYGPDCSSSVILDWLRSLDQREREELLVRLNAHWEEKQQA